MADTALHVLEQLVGSPWLYAVVLGVALLDALLPAVPSETAVVTAGVFAASGQPDLLLLVLVAASGAIAGDHLSYLVGRRCGSRLLTVAPGGTRRRAVLRRAEHALERRGPLFLVVARYVPGGRTATTLTMGAVRYRLRTFTTVDVVAGGTWAGYSAGIGYLGGSAVEDSPLLAVVFAVSLALAVTAVTEVVARRRRPEADGHERRAVVSPADEIV